MKVHREHFCCHIAFKHNYKAAQLKEISGKMLKASAVEKEFRLAQQPLELTDLKKGSFGVRQFLIGSEDEDAALSVSLFEDQVSFCFSRNDSYAPNEKEAYGFVGAVLKLIPDARFDGFLFKGVAVLDDLPQNYLEELAKYFFKPVITKQIEYFRELSFEDDLEIAGSKLHMSYKFRGKRYEKSEKELMQLDYTLYTPDHEDAEAEYDLLPYLNELARSDIFQQLIDKKLPKEV